MLDLGKWALGQIFPIDSVMTALELAGKLVESFKSRKQNEAEQNELSKRQVPDFETRRQMDIQERTLLDLGLMLGQSDQTSKAASDAPAAPRIPCIVFCDDAQFARQGGDVGMQAFIKTLFERAQMAGWPLLLVLTHS